MIIPDNVFFLCNLCDGPHVDCMLTESDPQRGLNMGDTYHFEHLPPNIGYMRVRKQILEELPKNVT